MDPITNALTSLALARAARGRLPRFGAAMLVTAGVAADLDFVSYFGGPSVFLRFHRAVLHSILGSVAMCGLIAAIFCFVDRARPKGGAGSVAARLAFSAAFWVCAIGAGTHIVLDVASGIGVRLLWPFRGGWESWDLLANLDVWILIALVAGLFVPHLIALISEEIGERQRGAPGKFAAVATLVLLALYIGARGMLHSRATQLLGSRDYHGQPPQNTGAFPASSNPFAWRGLVSTVGAIEEMNISLFPGATFDPERAVAHYKPEESPAIAAAQKTAEASLFLSYARFPLATVEPQDPGFDVTIRDLRFPAGDGSLDNVVAEVQLGADLQVTKQRIRYAKSSRR
jgi:inner membrane protein